MKRKRTHKGPVNASKVKYDNILFASKLEVYCYKRLKEEGLFEHYEYETFTIIESFSPSQQYYERQANGKGELIDRSSRKVLGKRYTPDFTGRDYIIECKGRANERFPDTWKLFKRWCYDSGEVRPLYKPQNQKEIDQVIEIIKQKRNGTSLFMDSDTVTTN